MFSSLDFSSNMPLLQRENYFVIVYDFAGKKNIQSISLRVHMLKREKTDAGMAPHATKKKNHVLKSS